MALAPDEAGGNAMRILISTLTAASLVTAPLVAATQHTQTHGNPHTTTATTSTKSTSSPTSTTTTKTVAAPATTTITPLNPIAQKIYSHPQLMSKLTPMLPKGMTLNEASAGFKNQGQFIAALHVSKNLNIPFKDLRTQMVTDDKSLGQSIQTLKKKADAAGAVKTAENEADDDVKSTTTTSTTGSTTAKKTGK
jgi:hypothetical protein